MVRKDPTFEQALLFVQKKHHGHFRGGGMPEWQHLLRVSELLCHTLSATKEGTASEWRMIYLSALGHDLLEDTKATKKEIGAVFSLRGLALIEGMTNEIGDSDHSAYIQAMTNAEEAVRLIKLSDLYDNFTSVVFNLSFLGPKWTTSFLLPKVTPMHTAIKKTNFIRYKRTAEFLIKMVDSSAALLESELRHPVKK